MVRSNRSEIQNHNCDAVVLAQGQDPSHFGFAIGNSGRIFGYGFNALGEDEQTLVNAGGLHQPFFRILGLTIIFRSGEINSRCGGRPRIVPCRNTYFHTEYGM